MKWPHCYGVMGVLGTVSGGMRDRFSVGTEAIQGRAHLLLQGPPGQKLLHAPALPGVLPGGLSALPLWPSSPACTQVHTVMASAYNVTDGQRAAQTCQATELERTSKPSASASKLMLAISASSMLIPGRGTPCHSCWCLSDYVDGNLKCSQQILT